MRHKPRTFYTKFLSPSGISRETRKWALRSRSACGCEKSAGGEGRGGRARRRPTGRNIARCISEILRTNHQRYTYRHVELIAADAPRDRRLRERARNVSTCRCSYICDASVPSGLSWISWISRITRPYVDAPRCFSPSLEHERNVLSSYDARLQITRSTNDPLISIARFAVTQNAPRCVEIDHYRSVCRLSLQKVVRNVDSLICTFYLNNIQIFKSKKFVRSTNIDIAYFICIEITYYGAFVLRVVDVLRRS